jgi:AcrR family transcriptional regulator
VTEFDSLSPRERRHQRTKQAILDAARQIINREGVDALSIRRIADAIDYSPAGLYEYYGGKEEIIGAVCQQGFERFTRYLQRVDTSLPAEEYMVELGMAYIAFAEQNPDFFLLMFTHFPLMHGTAAEQTAEHAVDARAALKNDPAFGILYQGVERCVREGLFKPMPGYGAFEMAYSAWANVHGIAMLRITNLRDFPVDFKTVDRCGLRAFYRGLCAE